MLDIKFIRENKDIVIAGAKKKHVDVDIEKLVSLDEERLKLLKEIEDLRSEVNRVSNDIARDQDPALKIQLIEEMRLVKEDIKAKEEKMKELMGEWHKLMLEVPNMPDISVPEGKSEEENQEIKRWGEQTRFDFEPKDHLELMLNLKMVDFDRGVKVHGFRGYYLVGDGVKFSFALWNYASDFFSKKNFSLIMPPAIGKKNIFYGTGHLPAGVDDLYWTQDNDGLIATAEIPLMAFHGGEVLSEDELPKKYLGFSPCYRREAGAHGKDVKGLIRVNEFFKFEQLILCEANHDTSVKFHEELNRNFEEFIESLGLPYRTVSACGGDLGRGHVKMYDVEAWVPREEKYRELGSASYFHDFQSRRCNIRYKDKDGKTKYTHSLNATAVATPRILVSIIENYQSSDGKIRIPEVLKPYMGGKEFIG
ncbi:MAG TPA: serine--tRNA ligase [Candidatus Paceibacterota bacterium]|nr:serine--tRNA ligase [Candidatus Paceibacterota bacterium]